MTKSELKYSSKKTHFSIGGALVIGIPIFKNENGFLLHILHKNQFYIDLKIKCKSQNSKSFTCKIGTDLYDCGLGEDFFNSNKN